MRVQNDTESHCAKNKINQAQAATILVGASNHNNKITDQTIIVQYTTARVDIPLFEGVETRDTNT